MWILRREALQSEEVCLICNQQRPEVPEKGWCAAKHYAICQPKSRGLLGYRKIGNCELRIGNTENLRLGGHIGYAVKEKYRGNHMAEKACRLLFEEAKRQKMPFVWITCSENNVASRRTCERLGCDLQEIVEIALNEKKCIYIKRFNEKN